jgi:hypothetical protein
MKLFIDDIRQPSDVGLNNLDWVVVKSYHQAMIMIHDYAPQEISFDHDLGFDETGYDIAKELVQLDMDDNKYISDNFVFNVHSANPVGKKNIEEYLKSYIEHKRNNTYAIS